MVDDTEVDPDLLETEDKSVSYKLTNSCSQHEDQLRSLITSWTELKPDVCIITEVSLTQSFSLKILLIVCCRTDSACSHSEYSSVSTASFCVLY